MQNIPEKQSNIFNKKYFINTSNLIHIDHFRWKKDKNPCFQELVFCVISAEMI